MKREQAKGDGFCPQFIYKKGVGNFISRAFFSGRGGNLLYLAQSEAT
jgi:hypothetical protein